MKQQRIWGTLHPFFEPGPTFGRKEANAEFLTALLREAPFDAYHFFLKTREDSEHLAEILRTRFGALWDKGRINIGPVPDMPAMMARNTYSCFHLSDWVWDFVPVSIMRNAFSKTLFPVTAPVHTLSYAPFGPQLFQHMWPGVTKRDRIIATSKTTRRVLENLFSQFRTGYGLDENFPRPSLACIPLGVDLRRFAAPDEKTEAGKDLRARLGVGDATLFLGFSRLSPLSKMDFLPIFDAFVRAREKGLDTNSCAIVFAGRMPDKSLADILVGRARECGLRFSLVDFPEVSDPALRKEFFAAADVFISPVDNIQETFGLTIIEAFASSLPVIASGIDGYTELVSHGKDGFLLPTLGPSSTNATTALSSLALHDLYHLFFAQQCVVDPDAFADAILRLATDANLRREMGRAGYAKARTDYAWENVLAQYLRLWEECASTPLSPEEESRTRKAKHPAMPDYAQVFRHYFTAVADDEAIRHRTVRLGRKGEAVLAGTLAPAMYVHMTLRLEASAIVALLTSVKTPLPFGELADKTALPGVNHDRNHVLLWALKHGYLEFSGE